MSIWSKLILKFFGNEYFEELYCKTYVSKDEIQQIIDFINNNQLVFRIQHEEEETEAEVYDVYTIDKLDYNYHTRVIVKTTEVDDDLYFLEITGWRRHL